jgi:hypothetical protein
MMSAAWGTSVPGSRERAHEIADDLALTPGVATELSFSAVLPGDAEPTTEAVHSSLEWYVQPRVMFEGLTGGVESARRGIVVFTA